MNDNDFIVKPYFPSFIDDKYEIREITYNGYESKKKILKDIHCGMYSFKDLEKIKIAIEELIKKEKENE